MGKRHASIEGGVFGKFRTHLGDVEVVGGVVDVEFVDADADDRPCMMLRECSVGKIEGTLFEKNEEWSKEREGYHGDHVIV